MPNHHLWRWMPGWSPGMWCGVWPWRPGTSLRSINPSVKKNWLPSGLNDMRKITAGWLGRPVSARKTQPRSVCRDAFFWVTRIWAMSCLVKRAWVGPPVGMLPLSPALMSAQAGGGPPSVLAGRGVGPKEAGSWILQTSGPGLIGHGRQEIFRWGGLAPEVMTGPLIFPDWWLAVAWMAGTSRQVGCPQKPDQVFPGPWPWTETVPHLLPWFCAATANSPGPVS